MRYVVLKAPTAHSLQRRGRVFKNLKVESLLARSGGESLRVLTQTLGQAFAFCLGAVSARSVHALGRTPPQSGAKRAVSDFVSL
jgi:hypothetical protein